MSTPLDRTNAQLFQAWIAERLGLQFDADKLDWLEELLGRRQHANGCRAGGEYLLRLTSNGSFYEAERMHLVEYLTVGETYFYRNNDHFRAWVEGYLLSRLATASEVNPIRILSAGCASGEEPYTLAMLLRETAPQLARNQFSIQAVDLNRRSLERAQAARYTAWSLRQTPEPVKARFFDAVGKEFELSAEIRGMVSFREENLADPAAPLWREAAFDAIFCRNVLMYFTPDAMRGVVDRLTRLLKPGGVLFLGHAETLRGLTQEYHLCNTHETFYYQRKAPGESVLEPQAIPGAARSNPNVVGAGLTENTWPTAIEEAAERIKTLHAGASGLQRRAMAEQPSLHRPMAGKAQQQQTIALAMELLRLERHSEALDLLRPALSAEETDADTQLLVAVLLINAGRLAEGQEVCTALLKHDELNAGAHYLMALCHEQLGHMPEAIRHNQTAVYLDPTFAMPQLHLGLIARRAGDTDGAVRALQQAQLLLAREDAARILLFGGGFSREVLRNLCEVELRRWGGVA